MRTALKYVFSKPEITPVDKHTLNILSSKTNMDIFYTKHSEMRMYILKEGLEQYGRYVSIWQEVKVTKHTHIAVSAETSPPGRGHWFRDGEGRLSLHVRPTFYHVHVLSPTQNIPPQGSITNSSQANLIA